MFFKITLWFAFRKKDKHLCYCLARIIRKRLKCKHFHYCLVFLLLKMSQVAGASFVFVIICFERIRTTSCVKTVEHPLVEAVFLCHCSLQKLLSCKLRQKKEDSFLVEAMIQLKLTFDFLWKSQDIVFCALAI